MRTDIAQSSFFPLGSDEVVQQRLFVQTVYAWMTGGLLVTTLAAWATLSIPAIFELSLSLRWVLAIAMIGLVIYLSARIEQMAPSTAKALLSALLGAHLARRWRYFFTPTQPNRWQRSSSSHAEHSQQRHSTAIPRNVT